MTEPKDRQSEKNRTDEFSAPFNGIEHAPQTGMAPTYPTLFSQGVTILLRLRFIDPTRLMVQCRYGRIHLTDKPSH